MKRFLMVLIPLILCSCTILGEDLRQALEIQTHYTRQYVEFTKGSVKDEQMRGIADRLLINCDEIDKMVKE